MSAAHAEPQGTMRSLLMVTQVGEVARVGMVCQDAQGKKPRVLTESAYSSALLFIPLSDSGGN